MRNPLPSINIRTDNAARFCETVVAIAEASGSFTIKRDPALPSIVSLKFIGPSPHKEPSVQLICAAADEGKATVEIRASIWQPDPPTYEVYRVAAEAMIKPLLATYNRNERTRVRMMIATKKSLEPRLPPQSDAWFKRFTTRANKSSLHPTDWRRFYDFVRCSRARRVKLTEQDMCRLLLAEGFRYEVSADIARAYELIWDYERPRNTAEALDYFHFKRVVQMNPQAALGRSP